MCDIQILLLFSSICAGVVHATLTWMSVHIVGGVSRRYRPSFVDGSRNNLPDRVYCHKLHHSFTPPLFSPLTLMMWYSIEIVTHLVNLIANFCGIQFLCWLVLIYNIILLQCRSFYGSCVMIMRYHFFQWRIISDCLEIINTRRKREGCCSQFVCLFVANLVPAYIRRACTN